MNESIAQPLVVAGRVLSYRSKPQAKKPAEVNPLDYANRSVEHNTTDHRLPSGGVGPATLGPFASNRSFSRYNLFACRHRHIFYVFVLSPTAALPLVLRVLARLARR